MTIIFFTCYVSFNSFFLFAVNGSTSLKAIMHQITESVSEFIYFAMKHLFTKWNFQGQLFSDIKAEFTSADTR